MRKMIDSTKLNFTENMNVTMNNNIDGDGIQYRQSAVQDNTLGPIENETSNNPTTSTAS